MGWEKHFLNAENQLDGIMAPVSVAIDKVKERAETVTEPLDIDIVIQAMPGRVIPERGFVGHAPSAGIMYLSFDPENENLKASLDDPLERIIAHELHHIHRWRGPGYGTSLSEALVSEGLAGQFVKQLFHSQPEPWEMAFLDVELAEFAVIAAHRWEDRNYDHQDWFFGRSGFPRWAGYSLGYKLVESYLMEYREATAASLIWEPSNSFLGSLESIKDWKRRA